MPSLPFDAVSKVFDERDCIVLAYLLGSVARGIETELSDLDLAVLLEEEPEELLGFYLRLVDDLSVILGDNVVLVLLNEAPPLLRYQVIKHGKIVYCRSEKKRVRFEAKSMKDYCDLRFLHHRYDQVLLEEN